ncbi:MAG: type I-E CRISPR-associated protein Cse2/CasB [Phycisphaerae bacterium]|nr:type I-E CRISPR-associated protein Cse2/CasB [Phycisphaerae bacterium]
MGKLEDRFIGDLERLHHEDDRATLARLRRGLGKPVGFCPERDGWVCSRLPSLPEPEFTRRWNDCALTASLFAIHPEAGGQGNLGASFRRLKDDSGGDGAERRFAVLLDSDQEDLPGRLRHAVTLLKSKDIPIDWRRLLYDLQYWDHPTRFVQRHWARDFWANAEHPEQVPTAGTE